MGEARNTSDAALEARFEAVAELITNFRPREPHHYPNLFGGEASIPYERIFASLARGREAIDLAIGEGLRALEDRDQLMDLGYSRMTDYARQELGLPASTARDKVKLARGLADRPLLREAVRSGKLSPRKALEVLPVARGSEEKRWLRLAETLSVRELRRAVRRSRRLEASSPEPADGERWKVLSLAVRPELRVVVEEALRLAGESLGRGARRWQRLEAMALEFLGWHAELDEDEPKAPAEGPIPPEDLEKALEIESNGWDWLEAVEPAAAPEVPELEPEALHARLKALVEKRRSWDEVFGIVARGFAQKRMATKLGFANLGQYLKERLGMGRRAVEQRVWLEKRMEALPQLRYALERGEVSYEKARLVAGVATDFDSVNAWIRRAEKMTCVQLERAIDGAEDAQACVRGRFEARAPEPVASLLEAALRVAGKAFGTPDPGERLVLVAAHFVAVWGPLLQHRNTLSQKVQDRDGNWCTTPGCSRPSDQDHHLLYRSQGGGDDMRNQTAICAPHHLRGVHAGRIRVSGTAPDHLVWTLASGRVLGVSP